jgi:hypothetical protein
MKIIKLAAFVLLASITLFSCRKDCIEESGTEITEYNDISGFTGISSDGNFDIVIDTGSYEVSVKADRAFVPYIKFEKTGNILNIYVANNRCLDGRKPYIHIYAPNIDYIEQLGSGTTQCYNLSSLEITISNKGSGNFKCYNFYNDELTIENEASGDIEVYNLDTYNLFADQYGSGAIFLDGFGKFANYNLSASGLIDGLDFEVERGNVTLSGSGKVYVNAYQKLDAVVSGSGVVYYEGHAGLDLQYSIPGSGAVIMY